MTPKTEAELTDEQIEEIAMRNEFWFEPRYDNANRFEWSKFARAVLATDRASRAVQQEAYPSRRPKFKTADERQQSAIEKAIHALNHAHGKATEGEDRVMYGAAGMLLEALFTSPPARTTHEGTAS